MKFIKQMEEEIQKKIEGTGTGYFIKMNTFMLVGDTSCRSGDLVTSDENTMRKFHSSGK